MEDKSVPTGNQCPEMVKKTVWSDKNEQGTPSLKTVLRPFLYSMALAGCYNFSDIDRRIPRKGSAKSVLSNIYRAVVMIIIMLYLARNAVALFFIPKFLFLFVGIGIGWTISLIATYLVFLKMTSSKYGHFERTFIFCDQKIIPEFQELGIKFPASKMRKRTRFIVVVTWLVVIVNVVSTGMQMLFNGAGIFTSPFESTPGMIVLFLTFHTFASALWILPTAFICMLTKLMYEAFCAFNEFANEYFAKHRCKLDDDFHRIRLLHTNLCKLVKDFDADLGWYYASAFTFNLGMAVFIMYNIIKTAASTNDTVLLGLWFFWLLIASALLAFYAAFVNDAAHSPLDTIYYVDVKDITVEKLAQLNLFLSKLTGTQVGFTACGLLVITKEFILTIAGAFLTYFAVLYTL